MVRLDKNDIVGKCISLVFTCEKNLSDGFPVTEIYLLLDTGLILQLLPYGVRPLLHMPDRVKEDKSTAINNVIRAKITNVVTDDNYYHDAINDKTLSDPPYDDVYVILDNGRWIANRFFENGENALITEENEELSKLSDKYYDYWNRCEVIFDEQI